MRKVKDAAIDSSDEKQEAALEELEISRKRDAERVAKRDMIVAAHGDRKYHADQIPVGQVVTALDKLVKGNDDLVAFVANHNGGATAKENDLVAAARNRYEELCKKHPNAKIAKPTILLAWEASEAERLAKANGTWIAPVANQTTKPIQVIRNGFRGREATPGLTTEAYAAKVEAEATERAAQAAKKAAASLAKANGTTVAKQAKKASLRNIGNGITVEVPTECTLHCVKEIGAGMPIQRWKVAYQKRESVEGDSPKKQALDLISDGMATSVTVEAWKVEKSSTEVIGKTPVWSNTSQQVLAVGGDLSYPLIPSTYDIAKEVSSSGKTLDEQFKEKTHGKQAHKAFAMNHSQLMATGGNTSSNGETVLTGNGAAVVNTGSWGAVLSEKVDVDGNKIPVSARAVKYRKNFTKEDLVKIPTQPFVDSDMLLIRHSMWRKDWVYVIASPKEGETLNPLAVTNPNMVVTDRLPVGTIMGPKVVEGKICMLPVAFNLTQRNRIVRCIEEVKRTPFEVSQVMAKAKNYNHFSGWQSVHNDKSTFSGGLYSKGCLSIFKRDSLIWLNLAWLSSKFYE